MVDDARLVLTTAEVAARLGMSVPTFHRRQAALKREHGFPGPVPGLGHRYDPEAIRAWLARKRQPDTPAPVQAENTANDWSTVLAERAARLAGRA